MTLAAKIWRRKASTLSKNFLKAMSTQRSTFGSFEGPPSRTLVLKESGASKNEEWNRRKKLGPCMADLMHERSSEFADWGIGFDARTKAATQVAIGGQMSPDSSIEVKIYQFWTEKNPFCFTNLDHFENLKNLTHHNGRLNTPLAQCSGGLVPQGVPHPGSFQSEPGEWLRANVDDYKVGTRKADVDATFDKRAKNTKFKTILKKNITRVEENKDSDKKITIIYTKKSGEKIKQKKVKIDLQDSKKAQVWLQILKTWQPYEKELQDVRESENLDPQDSDGNRKEEGGEEGGGSEKRRVKEKENAMGHGNNRLDQTGIGEDIRRSQKANGSDTTLASSHQTRGGTEDLADNGYMELDIRLSPPFDPVDAGFPQGYSPQLNLAIIGQFKKGGGKGSNNKLLRVIEFDAKAGHDRFAWRRVRLAIDVADSLRKNGGRLVVRLEDVKTKRMLLVHKRASFFFDEAKKKDSRELGIKVKEPVKDAKYEIVPKASMKISVKIVREKSSGGDDEKKPVLASADLGRREAARDEGIEMVALNNKREGKDVEATRNRDKDDDPARHSDQHQVFERKNTEPVIAHYHQQRTPPLPQAPTPLIDLCRVITPQAAGLDEEDSAGKKLAKEGEEKEDKNNYKELPKVEARGTEPLDDDDDDDDERQRREELLHGQRRTEEIRPSANVEMQEMVMRNDDDGEGGGVDHAARDASGGSDGGEGKADDAKNKPMVKSSNDKVVAGGGGGGQDVSDEQYQSPPPLPERSESVMSENIDSAPPNGGRRGEMDIVVERHSNNDDNNDDGGGDDDDDDDSDVAEPVSLTPEEKESKHNLNVNDRKRGQSEVIGVAVDTLNLKDQSYGTVFYSDADKSGGDDNATVFGTPDDKSREDVSITDDSKASGDDLQVLPQGTAVRRKLQPREHRSQRNDVDAVDRFGEHRVDEEKATADERIKQISSVSTLTKFRLGSVRALPRIEPAPTTISSFFDQNQKYEVLLLASGNTQIFLGMPGRQSKEEKKLKLKAMKDSDSASSYAHDVTLATWNDDTVEKGWLMRKNHRGDFYEIVPWQRRNLMLGVSPPAEVSPLSSTRIVLSEIDDGTGMQRWRVSKNKSEEFRLEVNRHVRGETLRLGYSSQAKLQIIHTPATEDLRRKKKKTDRGVQEQNCLRWKIQPYGTAEREQLQRFQYRDRLKQVVEAIGRPTERPEIGGESRGGGRRFNQGALERKARRGLRLKKKMVYIQRLEAVHNEKLEELKGPYNEWQLRIEVLDGSGLCVRDSNGKSDPYIKLRLFRHDKEIFLHNGKSERQVRKGTLNPKWNYEIKGIEQHHKDDFTRIELECWDSVDAIQNREEKEDDFFGSSDFMGIHIITRADLIEAVKNNLSEDEQGSYTFSLNLHEYPWGKKPKKGDDPVKGFIRLKIEHHQKDEFRRAEILGLNE
eukprot:jgi/Bigna1/76512/fgenesh1_pg.41_\